MLFPSSKSDRSHRCAFDISCFLYILKNTQHNHMGKWGGHIQSEVSCAPLSCSGECPRAYHRVVRSYERNSDQAVIWLLIVYTPHGTKMGQEMD
jgi:hypothetical protein